MKKFTATDIAMYITNSTMSMYEDGDYYVHWSEEKGLNYDGNTDPNNITVISHCDYADGMSQSEFYAKENLCDTDFLQICDDLANKLNSEIGC